MINFVIVTRPLSKPEVSIPSIPDVTQNAIESIEYSPSTYSYSDLDLSGLPSYYYNPFSLLMSAFSSFIWILILAVMAQAVIWGIISIFFVVKSREIVCPKCKKKIHYTKNKPKRCLSCGTLLFEDIKPH